MPVCLLKKFQLVEGSMLLLIVPIAYVLLKFFNTPPISVFLIHFVVELCTQYVRLKIVLPMIHMEFRNYVQAVILPILRVVILSPIIPCIFYYTIEMGILRFFMVCIACLLSCLFCIFKLGCSQEERMFLARKAILCLQQIKGQF